MQTFTCNINGWNVEARVDEMAQQKLLAIVSARPCNDLAAVASSHVVVCDHEPGHDEVEEVKTVLMGVLPAMPLFMQPLPHVAGMATRKEGACL